MWSVLTGKPVPEPRLAGLTVGVLTRPPSVGEGNRPPANLAAEAYVDRLEELGARCVAAEIPEPEANTWPVFFYEAKESHRPMFPARADEYGDNVRRKLELAQSTDAEAVAAAYRALESWRALRACGRPLRLACSRHRPAARGLRRARSQNPLHCVRSADQPARLGRSGYRRPAAHRATRRDRPCRWARVGAGLAAFELGRAFLAEGLHALAEVVRRPQQAVGEPFDLQSEPERAVVGVVQHALRHRECER